MSTIHFANNRLHESRENKLACFHNRVAGCSTNNRLPEHRDLQQFLRKRPGAKPGLFEFPIGRCQPKGRHDHRLTARALRLAPTFSLQAQVASKIETLADLKGKAVGVQDDSTGSYLLDGKYADMRKGLKEYKKYPDFAAAFLDIDSGRLDALVVDEILVRYYMKKAPGKYKVLKEDLGKEVVGVGFRKDDKEFAARIDKILDEMKKDGTCKKISMQWFGTDITRYEDKK